MHVETHHASSVPLNMPQLAGNMQIGRPTAAPAAAPTSTSTATITANDFLQLLVTELKNQDPTSNTDPNEYVDQLVQVNSLQQQIQMNETMDGGPTLTGSSSGLLQELASINQTLQSAAAADSESGSSSDASKLRTLAADDPTVALSSHVHPRSNLNFTADQIKVAASHRIASALAPKTSAIPGGGAMQAFEEFAARLKAAPVQK